MQFYKFSNIFQPLIVNPNRIVSNTDQITKSQRLLLNNGFVYSESVGLFNFLPLGQIVFDKLIRLVDKAMHLVNGQKIVLSSLIRTSLLKQSGRYDSVRSELFCLNDRHNKELCLAPTHEESITKLISSMPSLSYKQMPLRLYQITNKYRDEKRPKYGLMRTREFLMKDMYSFDTSLENAQVSYDQINDVYDHFFDQFDVKYQKVVGNCGNIGGIKSHEFHFISEHGDDKIKFCNNCKYKSNINASNTDMREVCDQCQSTEIEIQKGIEVGHTFLLGDRYSQLFKCNAMNSSGVKVPMIMGSYGIGLTRVLASVVDILSLDNEIRWPDVLAPFDLCIITPKSGSNEYFTALKHFENLMNSLKDVTANIVWDDRHSLSIGKRIFYARNIGIPLILVVGKGAVFENPVVELYELANDSHSEYSLQNIIEFLKVKFRGNLKTDFEFKVCA